MPLFCHLPPPLPPPLLLLLRLLPLLLWLCPHHIISSSTPRTLLLTPPILSLLIISHPHYHHPLPTLPLILPTTYPPPPHCPLNPNMANNILDRPRHPPPALFVTMMTSTLLLDCFLTPKPNSISLSLSLLYYYQNITSPCLLIYQLPTSPFCDKFFLSTKLDARQ